MKKHLAVLLIAILATSGLSAAGVVTTSVAAGYCPPPGNNVLNSQGGTTVNVKIQVSPAIIIPQSSKQVILVTILSNKNSFDPQIGTLTKIRFGRAGQEAAPIGTPRLADVDHDGINDVTFAFKAQDTGLRFLDFHAKLTGEIDNVMCPAVCGGSCVSAFEITGTASVLAL
jgi:hypothetical protein